MPVIKTVKEAKKAREKITLLYFLCNKGGINIDEELAKILPLVSAKVGQSDAFKPVNCEALAWYRISEDIPYTQIMREGETLCSFFAPTDEELETINKETYTIKAGHSLLGDIEALLNDISEFATAKDRKTFTEVKLSIGAKAPEDAKKIVPGKSAAESNPVNTANIPEKEDTSMSKETKKSKKAKDPKKDKKTKATAIASVPNPEPTPEPAPTPDNNTTNEIVGTSIKGAKSTAATQAVDPYTEAIELSSKKKLPAYFDQDIKSHHIPAGIYCHCNIKLGGKRKVSKKAIFIDCSVK